MFLWVGVLWCVVLAADENNDPLDGFQDISPDELDALSHNLSKLVAAGGLDALARQLGIPEGESQSDFVQKAFKTLSELLANTESRDLLADPNKDPREIVEALLKGAVGVDQDAVDVLLYLCSMIRVLTGNDHLKKEVNRMILDNAELLAKGGDFATLLINVAEDPAFRDLKEEIEDDVMSNGGYSLSAETENDMSR
ncbi:uncharacterized protein LOC34619874 [Cyclospora cayetanensis]|uniref:Uncharacterized protein LOC34619874 n=1 Tax=Cyclospora cayetanensis TaxID=88456 RepID=A0A6P6RW68_9EIME|nr:uncharacterized protein LOC34619874 [Cyclospora cayetanensis]